MTATVKLLKIVFPIWIEFCLLKLQKSYEFALDSQFLR